MIVLKAASADVARPGDARREMLLRGPVLPTLLRLAVPTITVLFVQTLVSVAETYFVSFLGTAALAGVSLVFPLLLLMAAMSNGGMGGGVSAAVARALGAGRTEDANRLVVHALVLGVVFGACFSVGAFWGGPALYRALGGSGEALGVAVFYSNVVFAAAIPVWCVNLLAAALRGAGNVKTPALVTLGGALVLIPLSPALIFGWGPLPRMGVAGAALAVGLYYTLALVVLAAYMRRGHAGLLLRWAPLERRLFAEILRVGALSAVGTAQANLTVVLVTGAVGRFGTEALAGYGLASRLDSLLIPLLFGLGTAVLTMVGTNIGAGQVQRARRAAWTGAWTGALFAGAVGLAAALFPLAWLGLFSREPKVLAAGALYLRHVAPCYGFVGLGLLLYFAAQGTGKVVAPFLAGSVRLGVAAGLGWVVVVRFGFGLHGLFVCVALSSVLFGLLNAVALRGWKGAD